MPDKRPIWSLESIPPAAWLGRKDSFSNVPEFCKRFYASSSEKKETFSKNFHEPWAEDEER